MRSERGQATVEWIGIVLLLALTLAALSRFAPSAEGQDVGATLARSLTCAARDGCRRPQVVRAQTVREAFTAPPLVSHPRQIRPPTRPRLPSLRELAPRLRRGAGDAWRRAWIACLVYERFRYAFLHPESRFPGHSIPPPELLRIANDCISPVDLVRDWPLMRGR
jgi:hypothetical protein